MSNGIMKRVAALDVGDELMLPMLDHEQVVTAQRRLSAKGRFPRALAGWRFETESGVLVTRGCETRHCIVVRRVA